MKIFEHGHCRKENIVICKECECKFGYYNSDVITDMTTPDEEGLFGGFGVHSYVLCPECKCIHTLHTDFTPYESWVDKLCDWIIKRREKRNARRKSKER